MAKNFAQRGIPFDCLERERDIGGLWNIATPSGIVYETAHLISSISSTGFDDLRNVAIGRLLLDNFDHVKAYWIMMSPAVAQVALSFGVDDIDGTVKEEKIVHEAGATSPMELPLEEIVRLVKRAGKTPVRRDTLYNVLEVY